MDHFYLKDSLRRGDVRGQHELLHHRIRLEHCLSLDNVVLQVVVAYLVTFIVASGHGGLKKYEPMVIGCGLRTVVSSYLKLFRPLISSKLLYYYLTRAMFSGRFCILCNSRYVHLFYLEYRILLIIMKLLIFQGITNYKM